MKKALTLVALLFAALHSHAQYYTIYTTGGNKYRVPCEELDRIGTIDPSQPVKTAPAEAVDLGLSVRWASHNLGATAPHEFGGYYAWGENTEKLSYEQRNFWLYDAETQKTTFPESEIRGTEHDAAHVSWGGGWRLPSAAEIDELVEKCTAEWTELNGIEGYKMTGPNGNSIFLPKTGTAYYHLSDAYYRSDAYYWGDLTGKEASVLKLSTGNPPSRGTNSTTCYLGQSIRPVCP